MNFIKLTQHTVDKKPKSIYVSVDQICWVGESDHDMTPGYPTNIALANSAIAVFESVEAVMQMIKQFDDAKIVT